MEAVVGIVAEGKKVGRRGMKVMLKEAPMAMGMMGVASMQCMGELVLVTVIMLEAMNMVITTFPQGTETM